MLSSFSSVCLFVTLWTVPCHGPLSMVFSRQEYWSGLLCPPPGDLPDPGIEPTFPAAPTLQADSLLLSHRETDKIITGTDAVQYCIAILNMKRSVFNRSGHSPTQVRKNYSEFQQKGQRFNEFNEHFEGLKVKVTQLCLTLCDPMEYTVHGILQARIMEWQPFPSPGDPPNPWIYPGLLHCRQILYQLSTREAQEYWSGQPIPSPAHLPDPGIKPGSPALQADFFTN